MAGIGTLLGALLTPAALGRFAVGHLIVASAWLFATLWAAYALAPGTIALAAALTVALLVAAVYNGATLAYRLVRTPDAVQGRIVGIGRLLTYGGQALGYLLLGLLIERTGPVTTIWLLLPMAILLALAATVSQAVRTAPHLAAVTEAEA